MIGLKTKFIPIACLKEFSLALASIFGVISIGRLSLVLNSDNAASSRNAFIQQDGTDNASLNIFLVSLLAFSITLLSPHAAFCAENTQNFSTKGPLSAPNSKNIIQNTHVQNVVSDNINTRLKSIENNKPNYSDMNFSQDDSSQSPINGIVEYREIAPNPEKRVSNPLNNEIKTNRNNLEN